MTPVVAFVLCTPLDKSSEVQIMLVDYLTVLFLLLPFVGMDSRYVGGQPSAIATYRVKF